MLCTKSAYTLKVIVFCGNIGFVGYLVYPKLGETCILSTTGKMDIPWKIRKAYLRLCYWIIIKPMLL
jgi:hypothetical protein